MRKFLVLVLAIMMVAGTVGYLIADIGGVAYTRGPDQRLKTEVLGGSLTATLSSSITSSNLVLGMTYSDSAAGVGTLADLAAISSLTPTSTSIFAEVFVAAGGCNSIMFPFPKPLTNGLVEKNSTSTGVMIVYYE